MTDGYIRLPYDQYKAFEEAIREVKETTHVSVDGFYHKSIRLPIGDLTLEVYGPTVKEPLQ